jgi:hypothetical protein
LLVCGILLWPFAGFIFFQLRSVAEPPVRLRVDGSQRRVNITTRPLSPSEATRRKNNRNAALKRGAGVNSFLLLQRVLASRRGFYFANRTRHPLAGATFSAANKIEFVFFCQS